MFVNTPVGLANWLTRFQYQMPPHVMLLNDLLLDVHFGRKKRIIVSMPPRHGKSELISKYFPAWYLFNNPENRIILTSYGADFAASWGRKIKSAFKEVGGIKGLMLAEDSKAAHRFDIRGHQGGLNTAGVGGDITGKGAHLLIIDDPIKNHEEANSETYRNKVWEWFNATAYTRLEPGGAIIVIMTRWHYDDIVGRLLASGDKTWDYFCLPAIAEDDDLLGREPGEALWPERYDVEQLMKIKAQMSSYWFTALYQQQPVATETQIFKTHWWHYYHNSVQCDYIVQSWDTAFKTEQQNDYSVCTTWGITNGGFYLLDVYRAKVPFPELQQAVKSLYEKWHPSIVLIEDKASGQSLIQVLQRETRIPIKAVQVDKDKITRAHVITPLVEGGKVFLPKLHPLLEDVLGEFSRFPMDKHDDIVDSCVHALSFLKYKSNGNKFNLDLSATVNNPYSL